MKLWQVSAVWVIISYSFSSKVWMEHHNEELVHCYMQQQDMLGKIEFEL